jgi:signal transduction histidine kinase
VKHALLHEFMSQNREELLDVAVRKMKQTTPEWPSAELGKGFGIIIDEIIRALQHDAGLAANSPLPGKSEAASRHGADRQARGYAIEKIALDYGAISNAVGEVAAKKDLSFSGREYQVFNQCIDTAAATALEQFWNQAREQRHAEETTRVGFLAHELRNSLASARMAFALLRRGDVGIRSRTADVLDRSLTSLDDTINKTLLAVQLNSRMKPDRARISVKRLLCDVADAAVAERDIVLAVEADESLHVHADPRLLFSAVSNLVQNAIKFTHRGGRIVLRSYRAAASVVIEVEDGCGGLPSGKQEELFAPFVQKGDKHRGLGLGLAITREAIEADGGELSVRNIPDKGCVFTVALRSTSAPSP